jgi:hypothetical protein
VAEILDRVPEECAFFLLQSQSCLLQQTQNPGQVALVVGHRLAGDQDVVDEDLNAVQVSEQSFQRPLEDGARAADAETAFCSAETGHAAC